MLKLNFICSELGNFCVHGFLFIANRSWASITMRCISLVGHQVREILSTNIGRISPLFSRNEAAINISKLLLTDNYSVLSITSCYSHTHLRTCTCYPVRGWGGLARYCVCSSRPVWQIHKRRNQERSMGGLSVHKCDLTGPNNVDF